MPIVYYHKNEDGTAVSIWKLEEELDFFRSAMYLYEEEKAEIENLSSRKLLEWYASRYLLHKISGWDHRGPCLKDEHGKPYLGNNFHISLSHSNDWIAAAASEPAIGIDVQIIVEKITRIAPKFASAKELEFLAGDNFILGLHILWGAKESIYKAYGKRGIDFKKHIKIKPFKVGKKVNTTAIFTLEGLEMKFNIYAEQLDNYVLVLATHITS